MSVTAKIKSTYRNLHTSIIALAASTSILAAPISAQNNEQDTYHSSQVTPQEEAMNRQRILDNNKNSYITEIISFEKPLGARTSLDDMIAEQELPQPPQPVGVPTNVVHKRTQNDRENEHRESVSLPTLAIQSPRSQIISMYNSVETTKIPTNGEPLRILIITGDPHDKQFDYNRSFTNRAWFGYFYRTNYFHTGIEKHLSEHHNVKLSLIRRADEFFESIKTGSEELEGPLDVLIYGFHGRVDAFAMDTREPSRRRMKEIEPYTKIEEVFGAQIAEIFNNYDKIDYHQGLEAIYYYDVLHKAPMFREFFSDDAYVVGNSCSQAKKNTLFSVGNSFALALGIPYFGLDDNSGLAITTSKTGDNIFIHTHRQNTGRLREISPQVITRFW